MGDKLTSTCIRLPEDVRNLAIRLGSGSLTEGVKKSVEFFDAVISNPRIELEKGSTEAIVALAQYAQEIRNADSLIIEGLQERIRELEKGRAGL